MIIEVLRSLADWLNDPTNGLVAMLGTIALESGDTAPDVGTIADETRNALVAQERLPSFPGVAVNLKRVAFLDGEVATITRDGKVDVLVRVGRSNQDTENAARDTSYILRAAVKSLRLFFGDSRERNDIQIYSCNEFSMTSLWAPMDDAIVTGAVAMQVQIRDVSP
jgi:hypothetical protein